MSENATAEGDLSFSDADGDAAALPSAGVDNAAPVANERIMALPMRISVSIGGARLTIRELLALTPETIVTLDSRIEDPVEIIVEGRVFGRGELVEIEDDSSAMGVRLTEICSGAGEDR